MSQDFIIFIDRDISKTGHGTEIVTVINATYKRFIFHLMATVKLPDSKRFDTQISMHTTTHTADVSLSQDFRINFLVYHANMVF